jgi:hypothetical protein
MKFAATPKPLTLFEVVLLNAEVEPVTRAATIAIRSLTLLVRTGR